MGRRPRRLLVLALVVLARGASAGDVEPVRPYESETAFLPVNVVDIRALAAWKEQGISPAHRCSDEVFVRRVFLDLIGSLPEPLEARRFLLDRAEDKRARLVDALLEREEFAEYWAMRWCDALRVKAEFPVNLWPNAVHAYHRWILDALRRNVPLDRFARALLTSSGSNFREPAVNFYRAVASRTPTGLASAFGLAFLGERVERWTPERRKGLEAFFSRVAWKRTSEWKEEIVLHDPAPAGPLDAVFPDGVAVRIPGDADPRAVLADWLLAPGNPWFARTAANRTWAWIFGRGIVHEPDDARPDNPPSIPALLDSLAGELVESRYDVRHLLRTIVASRTYQQSPIPRSADPRVEALFACYPVRRLDAEVLRDTLCAIDGDYDEYESIVPEPWTLMPAGQRAVRIADGGISSSFLQTFGRPPRDTGLFSERNDQPTDAQRLYLLNSTDVRRRIERSRRLGELIGAAGDNRREAARWIYLYLLSREPTPPEMEAAAGYAEKAGLPAREAALDLAWALLNSKEFLCRH